MMDKRMKERCMELIEEIRKTDAAALLAGIGRGPAGIFSGWPSGMPRCRTDPETALLQREDVNEALDRLEELMALMETLGAT